MTTTSTARFAVGSTELLTVTVTGRAAVDTDTPLTLADQAVTISLDEQATWLDAAWVGEGEATATAYDRVEDVPAAAWVPADTVPTRPVGAWFRRKARTADPIAFTATAAMPVYVRVVDTAETPVLFAGFVVAWS